MGGDRLYEAAGWKLLKARTIVAPALAELQSRIAEFGRSTMRRSGFDNTSFLRFVVHSVLIVVSITSALLVYALPSSRMAGSTSEVTREASTRPPVPEVPGDSPRIGGEDARWGALWTVSPTATAMAALVQPSVTSSTSTAQAPSDERSLLSSRSSERVEPVPAPAPPKPMTFEQKFIAEAAPAAQTSQKETRVPASVTIAQAILESDWGRSGLSKNAHNYFGIKAREKEGTAGVVWMNTWEVINGRNVTVNEPFRAYKRMADSFIDHGLFFVENGRYASAMKAAGNAVAFAREIHRAGYATDPAYSDKLIKLMEKFSLFQYDLR